MTTTTTPSTLPGARTAGAPSGLTSRGRLVLVALLLATVLGQRLGIPVGGFSVPLILPLGVAAIGYLALLGDVRPDRTRLLLFLAAAAAMAASAYLAARYSSEVRLSALVVALAVWAPWALRARGDDRTLLADFARIARVFLTTMLVLAAVGVVQVASQYLGLWRYQDYLGDVVPYRFLLVDYNTHIPISWDSPIHKAQAFVFVEPSAFSQYVAIAIVVAILLRAPLWQVSLLGLGLISALSGTGLLLLAAGMLVLLLRAPRLVRPVYAVAGAVALAAVLLTPAVDVYAERADELNYQTSSLGLRFVLPYQEVAEGLHADQRRWVTGAGPGAVDRVLESGREQAGLAVIYTVPAKMLFEYGLLPAALLVTFILVCLFRGPPVLVLPGTVLAWLVLMGGYLATPHTVWTAWLLVPLWSRHE